MLYLSLFLIIFMLVNIAIKVEGTSTHNVFKYADEEQRKSNNKILKQIYKEQRHTDQTNKDLKKYMFKMNLL